MIEPTATALFGTSDPAWIRPLQALLEREGLRVVHVTTAHETLEKISDLSPAIVVVEENLAPLTSHSFLYALRTLRPAPEIFLVADGEHPASRIGLGPFPTLLRDTVPSELAEVIIAAWRRREQNLRSKKRGRGLVLCVDDDELSLNSVCRSLTRRGYHVSRCRSASEALSVLRETRPDLAIVDVMMPGTDGYALTEKIARVSNGKVPVVILSALSSDEASYEGHARGARSFLVKPCAQEELLRVVDSLIAS